MTAPVAGWYSDPKGAHAYRWWDGSAWASIVSDESGTRSIDPLAARMQPKAASEPSEALGGVIVLVVLVLVGWWLYTQFGNNDPIAIGGLDDARKHISWTVDGCIPDLATGTVRNVSNRGLRVTLDIVFSAKSTSTTLGSDSVTVELLPHGEARWSTRTGFSLYPTDPQCTVTDAFIILR